MKNVETKAYIIDKKNRKFWYVKYQLIFENETVKKEESTKVFKTERSLKFMQTQYLPAFINQKLDEYQKAKTHATTFSYYASIYLQESAILNDHKNISYRSKRILDDFAELQIMQITKLQVRQWINQLVDKRSKKDLSKRSKVKYLSIFRAVFNQAVDDDILERNIINDIRIIGEKNNGEEIKPFFKNEVAILLDKSKDPVYGNDLHDYLGIAFNQGISPAEIIGLQTKDICIANKTISINRNITKGLIKQTKNAYRKRVIPIFDSSIPYLHSLLKKAQVKKSLWLFSDSNGERLYDIANIRGSRLIVKEGRQLKPNTKWYKLLIDCSIEYRDLKNCRHTFAVSAIESNAFTMQEIADILGHNSLKMLIDHYAKWVKGKARDIDTTIDLFAK